MKKGCWKKIASVCLVSMMLGTMGGCGSSSPSKSAKKEKVVLWYLWTGAEGDVIKKTVKEYNKQSDKYEIDALSVPDQQKIMVAISSGNGPDLVDDFSNDVGGYVSNNIMEPLDDYIKKTKLDVDNIYTKSTLDSCKFDGKQYALPMNSGCSALYYNKDLLAAAGYTEPPKTMEELLEMSKKLTKTNPDGTIDTLGFPCFPTFDIGDFQGLCGASWYKDGKVDAENPGNIQAMKYYIDYRKQFGVDNVSAFTTAGKSNDPSDPFFLGKQAFRIDGNWLPTMIEKTYKVKLNYGIAPIPYPENHPELAGSVCVTSSMFFIPASAKNKDGAFDALKYITGPKGQKNVAFGMGNIPCAKELLTKENYDQMPGMDFYAPYASSDKTYTIEQFPQQTDYNTIINEETEKAFNLKETPEEATKNIVSRSKSLFK